jgi:hypothetical protein
MKMATAGNAPVLVAGNPVATALFAGMTLHQVGSLNDLSDEDVSIAKTGPQDIPNLCVTIKGVDYLIPFSFGFSMEKLAEPDWFLKCEFRSSYKTVKLEDGVTPQTDEHGNLVLDETKPYISFGKPSGITINSKSAAFGTISATESAGGPKTARAAGRR